MKQTNCDNCRYNLECRVDLDVLVENSATIAPMHKLTIHCDCWTEKKPRATNKEE